ncbi:GGDEF domain-containing protein [Vibrio campbellii]|uniref:diguanylate cyclase n=2 Tax=Vibrio TaxID=662 RepID=A0AAQ2Y4X6_9VIBR|nr:GGDEF domain-containing protein [Vibrio campbellii]MCR9910701.1 GGDEF domain-containing protein [Vibrio campbellii]NIY88965.1 GGDEF domain-containing protein [Vibrio campbellii]NVK70612.1 GGDEF domain-containing protein [Vibrio campbellii]WDG11773.1 GGDEF domain-containing protein [Vibrio campbellii]HDM8231807.1 GGDEF domain-containing protein [Vibrio campbellii]
MNAKKFSNDTKRKLISLIYLAIMVAWGIYTLTHDYNWQALLLFLMGLLLVMRNYHLENKHLDSKIAGIAAHSVTGIVILNKNLCIDFSNRNFSKLIGYTSEQLKSQSIERYDLNGFKEALLALETQEYWKGEIKVTNRFGDHLTLDTQITHYQLGLALADRYVISFRDISHRVRLERELKQLAEKDPLTSCWNRRRFDTELKRFANIADRYGVSNATLAIIDIDHFKQINDRHGHDVGDEVLKDLGELMKSESRETDIVARVGGEEFAIIMPETNIQNAFEAIHRLREIIQERSAHSITVSTGLATISRSVEQSYRFADRALYRAKDQGRNCVCCLEDLEEQKVMTCHCE